MKLGFAQAFVFALLAAVGNAFFVYGQKKTATIANPTYFFIFSLTICLVLFLVSMSFWPKVQVGEYLSKNWLGIFLGGLGCYVTYVGFYFLFTRYGASYYSLYAVLAIVTTSILVGVVVFKETFNLYYGLSILTALATIVLLGLGKQLGR